MKKNNLRDLKIINFTILVMIILISTIIYSLFLISHSQIGVLEEDEYFMKLAFEEAALALEHEDYPVGAIIVVDGEIISKTHNLIEQNNQVYAHAETLAINEALQKLNISDFSQIDSEVTLYVTYEPCAMDEGLIIMTRVSRVIIGKEKSFSRMLSNIFYQIKYRLNARGSTYSYLHDELLNNI